MVSLL
jgi:hypothetical protein